MRFGCIYLFVIGKECVFPLSFSYFVSFGPKTVCFGPFFLVLHFVIARDIWN